MKRILLLLVMMLSFAGANAQKQGFISTGQNVNVRTGPGKQYPLAKEDFSAISISVISLPFFASSVVTAKSAISLLVINFSFSADLRNSAASTCRMIANRVDDFLICNPQFSF